MMDGYNIANILLHVILISSFLVIFFFTYASKVEKQIVQNQSTAVVQDVLDDILVILPDSAVATIGEHVQNITPPDMSDEDNDVKIKNHELYMKTVKQIAALFVIGMIVIYIMSKVYKFSMKDLLVHNLIILFFVAVTEFAFLRYFAKNYSTIDSNYVKYVALKTIESRI